MPETKKRALVIGASGFLGGHVAKALLARDHSVRCADRDPSIRELEGPGCEAVEADVSDPASMQRAIDSVDAVYICIHTLSPQHADTADADFMEIERAGLENIVGACRAHGANRVVYVTSVGTAPDAPGAWLRGRWQVEEELLNSGLDATVIRPGMIVATGGRGFDKIVSQARKSVSVGVGGMGRIRTIAIDDLTYYMVGVLDDARAFGQRYDVGSDDALVPGELVDIVAEILGRRHPFKINLPVALIRPLAPLIEKRLKAPRGALKGYLDGLGGDGVGDPAPIREILTRPPLPFRESAEAALGSGGA